MIGYSPIGFYPIGVNLEGALNEPFLTVTSPISITAGGAFAALPDFVVTGSATVNLTATGTVLSTDRYVTGSVEIITTVAMDVASVNAIAGDVPIGLSCTGSYTAVNSVSSGAAVSLLATGSITTVLRVDGSIDIVLTGTGAITSPPTLDGIVELTLNALGYMTNDVQLASTQQTTFGVNTATGGHFVYTNYNFNGLMKIGSDYYATSTDGLFKITGTKDLTSIIQWKVTGPLSELGTTNLKALSDMYVHCRATGDITVNLNTDEVKQRDSYLIGQDDSTGLHRRRVKTHKGLRGTHWQVAVEGTSETEVSQVDCRVDQLKRSIY